MPEQNDPMLQRISRLVDQAGPLTLADYMHLCLADPEHGYYSRREAIGKTGDFITAPEITQIFGELIGVWIIAVWQMIGRPEPFSLVEFGPGNGTLMKDALRAIRSDPQCFEAARIFMVETSPSMIARQKAALADTKVEWIQAHDALPALPTIIIANEFLDALPARQFVRKKDHWAEIGVTLGQSGTLERIALPAALDPDILPANADDQPQGAVFEYAPAREALVEAFATLIAEQSGAALLIDYGHLQSGFGDTFQAVKDHAFADPLAEPGKADLTTHVDFERLALAAKAADMKNPMMTTQGNFLLAMGLLERAGSLGQGKPPETQERIRAAVERLAGPNAMGELFKVLGFASTSAKLPGFDADGGQSG